MTTHVTIPNGDIDQDSPVTQPLLTSLRDNLYAVIEGDVTAPKIQDAALDAGTATAAGLAWVAKRVIDPGAGGVGTYAFCKTVSGTAAITLGQTLAGSSLQYADSNAAGSGSPSGTWRAMGIRASGITAATLFQRIS